MRACTSAACLPMMMKLLCTSSTARHDSPHRMHRLFVGSLHGIRHANGLTGRPLCSSALFHQILHDACQQKVPHIGIQDEVMECTCAMLVNAGCRTGACNTPIIRRLPAVRIGCPPSNASPPNSPVTSPCRSRMIQCRARSCTEVSARNGPAVAGQLARCSASGSSAKRTLHGNRVMPLATSTNTNTVSEPGLRAQRQWRQQSDMAERRHGRQFPVAYAYMQPRAGLRELGAVESSSIGAHYAWQQLTAGSRARGDRNLTRHTTGAAQAEGRTPVRIHHRRALGRWRLFQDDDGRRAHAHAPRHGLHLQGARLLG